MVHMDYMDYQHYHLAAGIPIPLKNMSSSIGIITSYHILNIWKNKDIPNHQPEIEVMT